MITQTLEMTQEDHTASYLLIKDEHLASLVISSQTLAGSRVLMSTYQQVVFSDCVFYGVEFQGDSFENCIFENCTFEFSHFRKCNFHNCSFAHCTWKASSTHQTTYVNCQLDSTLTQLTEAHARTSDFTLDYEYQIAC